MLVPSGLLLAGPALADESPAPASGIGEPTYEQAGSIPATEVSPEPDQYPDETVPTTVTEDGYITGGTLQAGTNSTPATVAKPAAKPVTVTPRTRRTVRTATPTTSPAGPTVLPFTGPGRLELQLTVGGALVLAGAVVTVAARPRV
ncbi:MAG: hypothetical protein LC789_09520 [Actinobacteria bacterium]|nr:hypothetical protein [Actinomycetota bacterium]MCA1720650.1 hypothetical protein [Actinomycetota bacterium]